MFGLRIPGALVLLLATIFAPQEPIQSTLNVQVQDMTGAFIPDATIRLESEETKREFDARADKNGEATLSLDPGQYNLIVRARGFANWSTTLNLSQSRTELITTRMKVGSYSGPILIELTDTGPKPDRSVPDAEIPGIPLSYLALPSHKLRIRGRHDPAS
jgi:hypothetical protein